MGNEGRYHKDLDMRKPDLVAYEPSAEKGSAVAQW